MALTVQNVYGLLIRSKLLAFNDAKTLYERWQKEARDQANDLDKFRRWIVGHHYLTEYQASLLCKGHAEGFFISDYKILDRLGRGRMAGVYKAVHTTGQIVAIKVLPPSKAKVPYLLSRFQREAKLATQLAHLNVVRTYQLGESDGLHYIVMEYLEGETLEDVLNRRRRLPPAETVRIIYQTLLGLQHLLEKGMIHRDLKPSNMMLTPARSSGQPDNTLHATVKILDIGLGRMFFDETMPTSQEEGDQLTGEGVLLGTPDFLAPEQARDARSVDIRADIYSAGCVLYNCIAGVVPFPDTNIINQMLRHAAETPKPLKEFNADVPDGLQMIVNYMMAKDASQRYPTPERAAQALQVYLAANADLPRPSADDPRLSQFLMWVEGRANGGMPVVTTSPQAVGARQGQAVVPVARPAAPPPPGARSPGKGSKPGKHKRHSKHGASRWRKKKKKKGSKDTVRKPADFDVELVQFDAAGKPLPPAPPPAPAVARFSRRKLFLAGLAFAAVIGAIAAGGIAALLAHGNRSAATTTSEPEKKLSGTP